MSAYYNEIDPFAAQWLRNLIDADLIAPGDVDERSITEIKPNELQGYTQCHFFAGIGVWSYALRRAGWPDKAEVWTGSCPCQPFSVTGKRRGIEDERHLWPVWRELIRECSPAIIFGEQVAGKDALNWFDDVQNDLEASSYAIGSADLCAAGVGAPHIRSRLYFVAERLGYSGCKSSKRKTRKLPEKKAESRGSWGKDGYNNHRHSNAGKVSGLNEPGPVNGFWRNADWLKCTDGNFRPVMPQSFPMADGSATRVGRIRAYGNAICAEVATGFISAYLDTN